MSVEPQFGWPEELQREPEPPRRNPLWPVLVLLAVVAAAWVLL